MKPGFGWMLLGAGLAGSAGLAGCAAGASAPPNAAPASAVPPPPAVVVAEAPPPPPPPAPIMSIAAPPASPAPADVGRGGAAARARVDVSVAQRELEASMGNCTAACRALGSMDRAAGQVCALASTHDDARVCDESKGRVVAARGRVRASCGSCPNGPSVDPNAPVPSP